MNATRHLLAVSADDLLPVRRGDSTRVHLAYRRLDGEFVVLCGRVDGRGVHKSPNKITCRACQSERGRLVTLTAHSETAFERARAAHGGHPGPARRTTSVRLTDKQFAAIERAVADGYADGLNAVVARLVDEHLGGGR